MKLKAQLYKAKRDIKGKILYKILSMIDQSTVWDYCYEELDDYLSDYLNDSISDRYEMRDDYD